MKLKVIIKYVVLIGSIGLIAWLGVRCFGNFADDNVSFDNGRSEYEQQVDDAAE